MVHFNGDRMKLYDNGHLTLVDAALNAGFPNEDLFPKRGKEINFTLNGKPRLIRGEAGESAVIRFNGKNREHQHTVRAEQLHIELHAFHSRRRRNLHDRDAGRI